MVQLVLKSLAFLCTWRPNLTRFCRLESKLPDSNLGMSAFIPRVRKVDRMIRFSVWVSRNSSDLNDLPGLFMKYKLEFNDTRFITDLYLNLDGNMHPSITWVFKSC